MPHYTTFDANISLPPAQVVRSPQAMLPKPPVHLTPEVKMPQQSSEVSGEGSKQVFIKTLQGKLITVDVHDPDLQRSGAIPDIKGYPLYPNPAAKGSSNPQAISSAVNVMPPIDEPGQKNINEPFSKASPASQSSGGVGGLFVGNGSNGASSGTGGTGGDSGAGATGGDGGRGGNGSAAN